MSVIWTNQNWERVSIFLRRVYVIKGYQRFLFSLSFFFLQRFNLTMFLNTTTSDTDSTPIPVNSMSTILSFLFCSPHGILQIRFNFSSSSSYPVSTSARDSPTGSMSSPMGTASRFRVVVGLTSALLCHTRFPTVDPLHQNAARPLSDFRFLHTSLLGSS